MKARNKREGALTATLSIVALMITALTLIAFYSITKYVAFLLVALLVTPQVLLNFFVIIMSKEVPNFNTLSMELEEEHLVSLIKVKTFWKKIMR